MVLIEAALSYICSSVCGSLYCVAQKSILLPIDTKNRKEVKRKIENADEEKMSLDEKSFDDRGQEY